MFSLVSNLITSTTSNIKVVIARLKQINNNNYYPVLINMIYSTLTQQNEMSSSTYELTQKMLEAELDSSSFHHGSTNLKNGVNCSILVGLSKYQINSCCIIIQRRCR